MCLGAGAGGPRGGAKRIRERTHREEDRMLELFGLIIAATAGAVIRGRIAAARWMRHKGIGGET